MKYLLIFIFMVNTAFAQNATLLNKGDSAPFKGVLLTSERAEKAMKAEKANIVLKDLQVAQEELTEYHRQAARIARTELSKAQFSGFWANTGFFALGVILTGFAFKVNQKISDL